jgi:hypothetical protein
MRTNGLRRGDAAAIRCNGGTSWHQTALNKAEVSCAESATYGAPFVYVARTATPAGDSPSMKLDS